jgi:hypothetical protein
MLASQDYFDVMRSASAESHERDLLGKPDRKTINNTSRHV